MAQSIERTQQESRTAEGEDAFGSPGTEATERTYDEYAAERLGGLAQALQLPAEAEQVVPEAWRTAVGELASRHLPSVPPWPCSISDDYAPIEFSLVLDAKAPELRVLWEPQGSSVDTDGRRQVAEQTLERLEALPGVSTSRFRKIEPLFFVDQAEGNFLAWHGARLWPAGPSEFKIYLNPAAAGRDNALSLVEEAMGSLGLERSWPSIGRALVRPGVDEIRYLSLDLRQGRGARLKAYIYHPEPTAAVVEAAAARIPAANGARLRSFFETVTAGREAPPQFCPGSCLSFVKEHGPEPVAVTLHVPVRGYVRSDAEVTDRVEALAAAPGGSERPFLGDDEVQLHGRAVAAMATRALHEGVGLTSYLSLRSQGTQERVTAYLATELFATEPPRST